MENLGKLGRDKVTGFEGIIVGIAYHLYGCATYGLTPKVAKNGEVKNASWFDEGRIEIIGNGIQPKDVKAKSGKTGGEDYTGPNNRVG